MSLTKSLLEYFEAVEAGRGPPVKPRETSLCPYVVRLEANLQFITSNPKSLKFLDLFHLNFLKHLGSTLLKKIKVLKEIAEYIVKKFKLDTKKGAEQLNILKF